MRDAFTPHTCLAARTILGWDQEQLAYRSGITLPTIQHFEAGRRLPRYKTVTALVRAFRNAGVGFEQVDGIAQARPAAGLSAAS